MKNPNHIAIIMDGNGRWGKKKFNNRSSGHKKGIENIKAILDYILLKKIKHLTLYAFSRDNLLNRRKNEINNIFYLLEKYLKKNKEFFEKNKIKLNFIGEKSGLPNNIKTLIKNANKVFNLKGKKLTLNIAFNYSSKLEILNSVKKIIFNKKKISEKNISLNLYTAKSKNPDLIIRTGGYKRLSNFLLWQSAYSELFFVDKLWPDFKKRDLNEIIKKYKKIKRNFGA